LTSTWPVADIICTGEEYPDHPVPKEGLNENHRRPYAVLDFFRVTDLWKESIMTGTNLVKVWRVRFEKINLDEPSWWAPSVSPGIAADNAQPPTRQCGVCGQVSKEIFTAGWTCLNHKCINHFTLTGDMAVAVNDLVYTKEFVDQRTRVQCEIPEEWTRLQNHLSAGDENHGTEKAAHGGFHCVFCGCCSRRIYWNKLICENPECEVEEPANMKPLPESVLAAELAAFNERMSKKNLTFNAEMPQPHRDPLACTLNWTFPIVSHTFTAGNYAGLRQYFLPKPGGGIAGSFTLIPSNDVVNRAENGPDALFRQLESKDIKLKRNPAAVRGSKSTVHHAINMAELTPSKTRWRALPATTRETL
jgi:hypothetical protein